MAYVGIDTQGARALGKVLSDTAGRSEILRRETVGAIKMAGLSSQAPVQLGLVQDGLATLGAGVTSKADLADQFTVDPQRTAAGLGVPATALGAAITGLIGFGGPSSLRRVFSGLAPPGADPALDAALARLDPVLLPALRSGQQLELTGAALEDLRLLALRLGIEQVGPPAGGGVEVVRSGFLGLRRSVRPRTDTEVFWHDFWADGRTVDDVLANPEQLQRWVSGTFELDRRLALAPGLPGLGDVLATHDFTTDNSDSGELAAKLAAAEQEFAAIGDWLPAFLVGRDATGPDTTQLAQTLAFATRVGWTDPLGATTDPSGAADATRFADAIAYLRANRVLQSALLPTGFEGDPSPLAFFNDAGIAQLLALGRNTGVIDEPFLGALAGGVDQLLARSGFDLSGATPVELTQPLQQLVFALVSTQLPTSLAQSPAIQGQFIASLGHLRQAANGPQLRQRIIDVVAAFRTLAITGPPALTERQLAGIVGDSVVGVLGRSRLRLRSAGAVRKNPEFFLVARQWGIPGGQKQNIGKYKFTWSFDDLGVLTGIRRKKRSLLSRAWDTIKAVGNAIWDSWKDNPFKAIFQVGKLALGALAFVAVPGLGAAVLALNVAEAAYHAIQGDWLAALGSGLAAFTAGADIFGDAAKTVLQTAQGAVAESLLGPDVIGVLANAKRAFDIGTSIFQFTEAKSPLQALVAGFGAVSTSLGAGGQLVRGFDPATGRELVQLGTTVRDVGRLVAPAAGVVQAIDSRDPLEAVGNGLLAISAGARALTNQGGVLAGPGVFGFGPPTLASLNAIAQGTGVAGLVSRAVSAADKGNAPLTASFLAQAVQAVNDPRTTVPGNRAVVAQRVADVAIALDAVFRGANPAAVAPAVIDRVTKVLDALNTPVQSKNTVAPDGEFTATTLASRSPGTSGLTGGSGVDTARPGGEFSEFSEFSATNLSSTLPLDPELTGGSGVDTPAPGGGFSEFSEFSATTLASTSPFDAELNGGSGVGVLFGGQADDSLYPSTTEALFSDAVFADARLNNGIPPDRAVVPNGISLAGGSFLGQPGPALPGLPIAVPPPDYIDTVRFREDSAANAVHLRLLQQLGQFDAAGLDTKVPDAGKKVSIDIGVSRSLRDLPDGGKELSVTGTGGFFKDFKAAKVRIGSQDTVGREVPAGVDVTGPILPADLTTMAVGEKFTLSYLNALDVNLNLGVKGRINNSDTRSVEVQRTEEGYVVTVFDEQERQGNLGATAKLAGWSIGGGQTTKFGEQYLVAADGPRLQEAVNQLFVHGGSLEREPDAMVLRRTIDFVSTGEVLGEDHPEKVTWEQTEIYRPEGVTGEVSFFGATITYSLDGAGNLANPMISTPQIREPLPLFQASLDEPQSSPLIATALATVGGLGSDAMPLAVPGSDYTQKLEDHLAIAAASREILRPLTPLLPSDGVHIRYDENGIPVGEFVDATVMLHPLTISGSQVAGWNALSPDPLHVVTDEELIRAGFNPKELSWLHPGFRNELLGRAVAEAAVKLDGVDFGNPSPELLPRRPAGEDQVIGAAPEGTSVAFAPKPPDGTFVTPTAPPLAVPDDAPDLVRVGMAEAQQAQAQEQSGSWLEPYTLTAPQDTGRSGDSFADVNLLDYQATYPYADLPSSDSFNAEEFNDDLFRFDQSDVSYEWPSYSTDLGSAPFEGYSDAGFADVEMYSFDESTLDTSNYLSSFDFSTGE